MPKVVTFGEIMLRLAPPGYQRFTQARSFDVVYGGGEANVAVSLANYGEEAEFVTRVPKNDLGDACLAFLAGYGVRTDHVARGGERLGIYFLETGAAQRGSKVVYDRTGSSFATIGPGMVDWQSVLAGADWFHWTGITPAVSAGAAEACREGIQAARALGLTISCDMNYRAKLWKWGRPAGEVMSELLGLSDVAIGNEEDADKVFGIRAPETDVTAGKVEAHKYRPVCQELNRRFPRVKTVVIGLRGSLSASHNTWSGVLWCAPAVEGRTPAMQGRTPTMQGHDFSDEEGRFYIGPRYEILPIVDRVGGGDALAGGLIYGLRKWPADPERALRFAIAASCLKHTIPGDFNAVSVSEVEALMAGDASGRVSR